MHVNKKKHLFDTNNEIHKYKTRNNNNLHLPVANLSKFNKGAYISGTEPGSSVGIVTGYGLDGPGSNPGGGEIFHTCPERPWGPPSLLYSGYWVFPWGKECPGCDAHPSPPSSAVGRERVELYLYSPLWAVRPVQSLSACTRVTFTFIYQV